VEKGFSELRMYRVLRSSKIKSAPLLCGRRTEKVLRKKLAVPLVAAMVVVMVASPAWAVITNNQGIGHGSGCGNTVNPDSGNHTAPGAGSSTTRISSSPKG
jgi:hypothetical protein